MKRKRLIILAIVLSVLSVGFTAYHYRHAIFPSEQMQTLRQLEKQLDLPKPEHRNELDDGFERDGKGVLHYTRRITLSYADASVVDILRSRLLENSWEEEQVNSYGTTQTHFKFIKGSGDATLCVGGYIDHQTTDDTPLYIALQASGEYSCNPAPGI